MDKLIALFTNQWQRKVVAILFSLALWLFIDKSIIDTKTVTNVPIRVINLPDDKIIAGMLPNGILNKRINLTLTGTKKVVDNLESGDLQILMDASHITQDDWVLKVVKKNLVSLNPSIDLISHITEVLHPDYIIKMSRLITAKIPIKISRPKGPSPQGYEFLDIWPQILRHTVAGSEEQIQELEAKGLELEFDMSLISKADLDKIKTSRENYHDDEVSYFIPNFWKKIALPFKGNIMEEINDPESRNLHVDFLRKEHLPIERDIALRVFYPLETIERVNQQTHGQVKGEFIKTKNGVQYLSLPLLVKDVSKLFLETIRDQLEIVIIAQPDTVGDRLSWGIHVVNSQELENRYISYLVNHHGASYNQEAKHSKTRVSHLRNRFRDYLQKITLFQSPDVKFQFDLRLGKDSIEALP